MRISITYAEAKRQIVLDVDLPEGNSAEQAIRASGILEQAPQIDLSTCKIGIYGKLIPLTQPMKEGDRVEIYRPALGKPPKKARAEAAAEGEEGEEGEEKKPPARAPRAPRARPAAPANGGAEASA